MANWFQIDAQQVLEQLKTDENGLSEDAALERRAQYGLNELIDRGTKNPWAILWEQMTGIMVVILIVSALISLALGEYIDALIILIIVILNAVLGFTQEYRAEQAMAALKRMAAPHVRVRRGGHIVDHAARDLVPGDIVLLEAGNAIPADARLFESANLRVQEAILTGESEPVEKVIEPIHEENPSLGDRINMVYMGTAVTYGRGQAVVTDTGMKTQLGKIAEMIQAVGTEKTPLQRRLEQLGRGLAVAALAIVALVFVFGIIRGEDARLMLMTSISMAVAAVPEGLPAVVTIALAIGAQRMLKHNSLIRKLPAVETLGSVTVICSDKTGTLTQNRMTVTVVDVAGNRLNLQEQLRNFSPTVNRNEPTESVLAQDPAVLLTLAGGMLVNDAVLEPINNEPGTYASIGDPTEGALVIAAARAGLWKSEIEQYLPRVTELPFDSERKRMSTVHKMTADLTPQVLLPLTHNFPSLFNPNHYLVFVKGAVDSLLEVCDRVWIDGETLPLTPEINERVLTANNVMAQNGMRVLGVAVRTRDSMKLDENHDPLERGLILIGMVGMIDPARPEAKQAVATAQTAGIRPMMITGDHPLTAMFIARELGIVHPDQKDQILTGKDLALMSVEQLEAVVEDVSVYARVSPEHKLKIVQALQDKGHIVAMTGDGVNDAPALKKADIGVAMGITGTDVSKEASDMVLLDDNFATIVTAVHEGRRIYDNIRKFVKYTMTSNAGEVWVMLLAPFIGMPLPLTPVQILWVNLVTDGLPGLALTVEKAESNTMQRKPYAPNENIFGRGMARDILWIGLLMGLISLLAGFIFWQADNPAWRTIVFTTLTLAQMGNALATRSERDSLFKIGLFSNKALLGSVLLTFVLQMGVIYLPFLNNAFDTVPLTVSELAISLALSTVVFFSVEIFKAFLRRGEK